jgi:release factor glutamine methyltransferase
MQRNFLKSKTSDSQIRLLQDAWHTAYQNTYDEGLKFLIKGLDFPVDSLEDVIDKILKKIPIQYILKKWSFYQGEYFLNENVLIPRPETEILVDYVISKLNDKKRILDLGTGSGCIAIELSKKLPTARITAIDISIEAIELAKKNNFQTENPVKFFTSNWFTDVNEKFDLIISNPPYISKDSNLDESLKFEPQIALYSKNNGLADLSKIIIGSRKYLNENGALMLEHGIGQEDYLQQKMIKEGFKKIELIKDFKDINRFIIGYG